MLRGDSQRKCQSNGNWSGDMPSCHGQLQSNFNLHGESRYASVFSIGVDCGDPGTPANGKSVLTGSTPGSVVKYSCNSGYDLVGNSKRKCQTNGVWSGSLPTCERE